MTSNSTNINNTQKEELVKRSKTLGFMKILILLFLFVLSFTFAILPLKLSFLKSNLKGIGGANAFSAGIFGSVALVHLLPESTEIFNQVLETKFPLSFFLTIGGYSLILYIEKVLFSSEDTEERNTCDSMSESELLLNISNHSEIQRGSDDSQFFKENQTDRNEENFKNFFSSTGRISRMLSAEGKKSFDTLLDHPFEISSNETKFINENTAINLRKELGCGNTLSNINNTYITYNPLSNKSEIQPNIRNYLIDKNAIQGTNTNATQDQTSKRHKITPYVIMIAFSIHAVFEGIAGGGQNKGAPLFYLFLAIACHKWVEAGTIGINFNRSSIKISDMNKYIFIFAMTTPLGILFGMILVGKNLLFEGFFFAISSGTFIYISASEVVIEEFSVSKYKKDKFFAFLLGAVLIFVLTLFENSAEVE